MRIALTVKGAGLGAWLDNDFANCMQVMVVDDNNRFTAWQNPYRNGTSATELSLAEDIIKEKVDVLITAQISQEVINKISKAGIKVLIKTEGTVYDLIDEMRQP